MQVKLKTALQLGTLFTIVLAITVSLVLTFVFYRGSLATSWTGAFFVTVILGIIALLMAGALYIVGAALSERLRRLEETARRVGSGELSLFVEMDGRDEIAGIARVFDEMIANMRKYVELIPAHRQLQDELDKMNEVVTNLRNRNMEISDSLQRLRRAQDQILHKERPGVLGKMFATVSDDFLEALSSIRQIAEKALATADRTAPAALPLEAISATACEAQEKLKSFTAFCQAQKNDGMESLDLKSVVQDAIMLTDPKWPRAAEWRSGSITGSERFPPFAGTALI
jgi:methyl-accepting chemotaxis protein